MEPPHVLHASNTSKPPKAPLQSTMNSAAATAIIEAVRLQVQVTALLVDENAPTTHALNHFVPSCTTHPSVFRWPATFTTTRASWLLWLTGNLASMTFRMGNLGGVPLSASKDDNATVGEIRAVDPVSANGDLASTMTAMPISITVDASASGATDTRTRKWELFGTINASADDERKRLTLWTI